jgi:alpha-L-fucosidase
MPATASTQQTTTFGLYYHEGATMTTITERRQAHEDDSDNVRAPLLTPAQAIAAQAERVGYRGGFLRLTAENDGLRIDKAIITQERNQARESLRRIGELIEPWENRVEARIKTHSVKCYEWHIECLLHMIRLHLGER